MSSEIKLTATADTREAKEKLNELAQESKKAKSEAQKADKESGGLSSGMKALGEEAKRANESINQITASLGVGSTRVGQIVGALTTLARGGVIGAIVAGISAVAGYIEKMNFAFLTKLQRDTGTTSNILNTQLDDNAMRSKARGKSLQETAAVLAAGGRRAGFEGAMEMAASDVQGDIDATRIKTLQAFNAYARSSKMFGNYAKNYAGSYEEAAHQARGVMNSTYYTSEQQDAAARALDIIKKGMAEEERLTEEKKKYQTALAAIDAKVAESIEAERQNAEYARMVAEGRKEEADRMKKLASVEKSAGRKLTNEEASTLIEYMNASAGFSGVDGAGGRGAARIASMMPVDSLRRIGANASGNAVRDYSAKMDQQITYLKSISDGIDMLKKKTPFDRSAANLLRFP